MSFWRTRSFVAAVIAVGYVGAAAVRADGDGGYAAVGTAVGLLWLALGWRSLRPPAVGIDRLDPVARTAGRWAVTGSAMAVVAALGPPGPGLEAAFRLGVGASCVASLAAITRLSSLGGIAARARRSRDEAAAVVGVLWCAAVALPAATAVGVGPLADPLLADYAAIVASLGSLTVAAVGIFRVYAQRRYELGVAERAAAALWLAILAMAVGVLASLMEVADPAKLVPVATLVGAVSITAAAVSQEPTRLSHLFRNAAALVLLCAPIVSGAVFVVYKAPQHAGLVLFVVTLSTAILGALAPRIAHRLAPERGLWIDALERATEAAKAPDPRTAVTEVLRIVRDELGTDETGTLYRFASRDGVTVDRAGYWHERSDEIPPALVDIVEDEPYRVLSTEALRYVQVTQPAVRDLVAWLDARKTGLVALVHDDEVSVGALTWPAAGREAPLTYEEVVLARRLADHLGLVTGAAAQLERSRRRELEAERALGEARLRVEALEDDLVRQGVRRRRLANWLAHPLEHAAYSPVTTAARTELTLLARARGPIALVVPPGVDAMPWCAVAHLASPKADGELVWSDGTDPREHTEERWTDVTDGPLRAARDGSLVILHATSLPRPLQRLLPTLLGELRVIFVVGSSVESLLARGGIAPALGELLRGRSLTVPSLRERPEDLRALALEMTARFGASVRGEPIGLTIEAQELILEYDWPGNDAELEGALAKATAHLPIDVDVIDADALAAALGDAALARSGRAPVRRAGS